ncbi:MAG: molybdopterin molybdotransferase MoeA [Verrucomicrobiae bacterium]|nr:molybdopterin molybdotransferase MoeA [Verrucomicrobiae bacterium]
MIEIEQVWKAVDRRTVALSAERIPLDQAGDRMLAVAVRADTDLPPFDQSAMDGYALGSAPSGAPFKQVATLAAGHASRRTLRPGEAARVFTGARLPRGTFAIARQEDCTAKADVVRVGVACPHGAHVRQRGGIARAGAQILPAGCRLLPGVAGLLASCNAFEVSVLRRPKIEHLVTGDELARPGEKLRPGRIRDANGPLIQALLAALGLSTRRRRLSDSAAALRKAVVKSDADLLLISGGSGPGGRDHARAALEAAGFAVHCSSVNSRPGRPLIFASRGPRLAFGLPGNPLSHYVTFHGFVRRAIARMEGRPPPRLLSATLRGDPPDADDRRRSWFPARLTLGAGGAEARPLRWKHSGDLTPLAEANALILSSGEAPLRDGDRVAVLPAFDTLEAA